MSVTPSNIVLLKPTQESNEASNGGYPSLVTRVPDTKNAILPDVSSDDRTNGAVTIRKSFFKVDVAALPVDPYENLYAYFQDIADPAYNHDFMFGTDTDTQGSLDWSDASFIGVVTDVDVASGYVEFTTKGDPTLSNDVVGYSKSRGVDTVLQGVTIADQSNGVYRITAGLTVSDWAVGDIICRYRPFTGGNDVTNPANVTPRFHTLAVTSAGGVATLAQLGAAPFAMIRSTINITMVNGTNYNYSIPELGLNGSGDTSTVTTVYHPDDTTQDPKHVLLSIAPVFFSGAFVAGDTISFKSESGSLPLWVRRTVEAGQSVLSGLQHVDLGLTYQTS